MRCKVQVKVRMNMQMNVQMKMVVHMQMMCPVLSHIDLFQFKTSALLRYTSPLYKFLVRPHQAHTDNLASIDRAEKH